MIVLSGMRTMMVVKKDEDTGAQVIDLIKFKIGKELKKSPKGSVEHETLVGILRMYEEGIVTIKWSNDDMWVRMVDGSDLTTDMWDIPELKEELQQLEEKLAELFPEDEE